MIKNFIGSCVVRLTRKIHVVRKHGCFTSIRSKMIRDVTVGQLLGGVFFKKRRQFSLHC